MGVIVGGGLLSGSANDYNPDQLSRFDSGKFGSIKSNTLGCNVGGVANGGQTSIIGSGIDGINRIDSMKDRSSIGGINDYSRIDSNKTNEYGRFDSTKQGSSS
jgi:hypothetical protein